jgi:hypothetical protein
MKKTYHLYFPISFVFVIIISGLISLKLFFSWRDSGSSVQLVFAIVFFLVSLMFAKPIIDWRIIEIESDYLTVITRFLKPLRINIAESLYQIVIVNDRIRSFRFRRGESHHYQISPVIYKNGDDMAKTISEYIKKHSIDVDVLIK